LRDSLLLIAAALLAFGLAPAGSFHFDDYALFTDPHLTSLASTRPLSSVTFRLNEAIGGRNPAGYLAVNLLLHLAAVLLLRSALSRILPPPVALLAALVFAVHPFQAEPVNYVFARGTLLATLLCIGAIRSWLSGAHWAACVWFAAALLAKEECVALPLFFLLLHVSISRNRKELYPIGTMLVLSVAAGLRVLWASSQVTGAGAGFTAVVSPGEYLSMQGVAILRYLWLIAIPWGFTVDIQLPAAPMWIRGAAWVAVAGLLALAMRWFPRARAGFWFIGAIVLLLPSSSIFPADDLAADRRMYLPMVAFSVLIALGLARLDRRLAAVLLLTLASISARYSYVWGSEQRLWAEAMHRAPGKVRPRIQLARAAGSAREALAILNDAERIAPADYTIASEQGRMYLALGQPAEALSAYGRALSIAPGDAMAIGNRGVALALLGQTDAARQDFSKALEINPCLYDARLNLKRLGSPLPAAPAHCRYTAEQRRNLDR